MAGGYNLGNMAAALRATGGDPAWLEELQRRQEQQQAESSPVPPEVDRALETLGSSYRTQQPETMREREAAIPENPYPEPVSEREFNPKASGRKLADEMTAGQNEALGLKDRQGEIASQGLTRQAEAAGELESERREGLSRAKQRVDTNRAEQHNYEAYATQQLMDITQSIDNPPDESKGNVLRIIGAMLSSSDKGGAVGSGLSMLGQSMAGDVQQWRQQIEQKRGVHESLLAAAKHEQGDSEHEIRVEDGLSELAAGVYNASLEKIKAEAGSEEVKRAADELQNGLRRQFVEGQQQKNAAQTRTRADDTLWTMDMDTLASQIAEGNVGKRGQAIYEQRAKASQGVRKGEADIDATLANTEKTRRGTEGGLGQEVVPGFVSTVELGPADKTAIHANAMAVSDVLSELRTLREIRTRNQGGTWNDNDNTTAQGVMGRISTKLSQMSGAGAPSESERELFMKSLTDPTGFYLRKDPTKLYDGMAKSFRDGFEAKLRSVGVVPAGAKSGAGLGFEEDAPKAKEPDGSGAPPPRALRPMDKLLSRAGPARGR